MELYEWSKHHIKFKDCMKKNIQHMDFLDHTIEVKEKTQDITYHIYETLIEGIKKLQNKQKEVLITLNTKSNFDTLLEQWDELATHTQLTIIFSNPTENQTWIMRPHIHNKITERDKIEEGIYSLFSNVPQV